MLVVGGVSTAVPTPSGAAVDVREDVLPWAEQDLAVAIIPGAGKKAPSEQAFLAGVGDRAGAEEFLAEDRPGRRGAQPGEAGRRDARRLRRAASRPPSSTGQPRVRRRARCPGDPRCRRGQGPGAGRTPPRARRATSCPRPASPRSTSRAQASSAARRERRSGRPSSRPSSTTARPAASRRRLSPRTKDSRSSSSADSTRSSLKKSPSFFSEPARRSSPSLPGEAGERAIGYVGVGEVGPTLAELLEQARPEAERPGRLAARRSPRRLENRGRGQPAAATCCPRSAGRRRWSPSPPTASPSPA